jgi:3-oxoacyl-[acyl-carrier-protein] synthase-3
MRYTHVCLEALGYTLPREILSSAGLEAQLQPLYGRLRLPPGRLELITGIGERRLWPPGTWPSEMSVLSARRALEAAEIDARQIGALVHASVCRDHLEPATACRVHHLLGLPAECLIYDVSNACLGLLNGVLQVANMIELGQISAGLVVGSEGSRQLLETTVAALNADQRLTRTSLKSAVASLTIGSASCAIVLVHKYKSRTGNALCGGVARAHTEHHALCHSGQDEAVAAGMQPLMETDSEKLLEAGLAVGQATFQALLAELDWQADQLGRTICHIASSCCNRWDCRKRTTTSRFPGWATRARWLCP